MDSDPYPLTGREESAITAASIAMNGVPDADALEAAIASDDPVQRTKVACEIAIAFCKMAQNNKHRVRALSGRSLAEVARQEDAQEFEAVKTKVTGYSGIRGQAKPTRFEVIDHRNSTALQEFTSVLAAVAGRAFVADDVDVELSYQDDGTTLKVFVKDKVDAE